MLPGGLQVFQQFGDALVHPVFKDPRDGKVFPVTANGLFGLLLRKTVVLHKAVFQGRADKGREPFQVRLMDSVAF